jgi:EF hand
MKRLVLLLVALVACKSDPKPAPAASADTTAQQTAVPRMRQSNRPALPDEDGVEGSNRPSLPEDRPWRHHRGEWGSDMTPEQREAMMKQRAENMRDRLDANGDGKLSYDELKNAPGRMHFDNPEEIDTNHDGDISADELAAAMKARRDAFRAQRQAQMNGGSGAAPAAPEAAPADPATPQ